MSAESRSHLNQSIQRRFRWIALSVAAILILVMTPLVVNDGLRLDVAYKLGFAPGKDIERLAGAEDGVTLIVAPMLAEDDKTRIDYRFRATFLARTDETGVHLTMVEGGRQIDLPLETYDFYANSFDGVHVLFQDRRDPAAVRGVLVNADTGEVTVMPPDSPYPTDIPGDWEKSSRDTWTGKCRGISPNQVYLACFEEPKLATYLAGDWEIQVRQYGVSRDGVPVFRGTGGLPWVGWSKDDSRLYFQNEDGVWVATISEDMFSAGN